MKFILLAFVFAFAAASPVPQQPILDPRDVRVIQDDRDVRPDGYNFQFETNDGYRRSEQGHALPESGALAQEGEIEFVMDDGSLFYLRFVADENGYRVIESPVVPTGKK